MNQGEIIHKGSPKTIFRLVDQLKDINLDIPVAVEVAEYLRQEKINIPDILSIDELVEALC